MKRFAATVGIGMILLVAGCGKDTGTGSGTDNQNSPNNPPSPDSSFTYELTENGCTTGKHVFRSHADLCRGLGDDGANHNCALQQRKDYFEAQQCAGRFGVLASKG